MNRFLLSVAAGAMLLTAGPVTQASARPERGRDRDRFEHGRDHDRFEHNRWWGDYERYHDYRWYDHDGYDHDGHNRDGHDRDHRDRR